METIVFNNIPSKVIATGEAIALRAAFLISDVAITAGNGGDNIFFSEITGQIVNPLQQIKFIEDYYLKIGEPFVEVKELIHAFKVMQKIKYKKSHELVLLKSTEAAIHKLYQTVIEEINTSIDQTGMSALKGLAGKPNFGIIRMGMPDIESAEGGYLPASRLLKPDAETVATETNDQLASHTIYCLTFEFFSDELPEKGKLYGYSDWGALVTENCWLHKCFTFPNLHVLSAVELQAVRKQLEPASAAFRKQMDAWVDLYDEPVTSEAISFFKKNLLAPITGLQQAIAQNELLNHLCNTANEDLPIELWMGEIPIEVFWRFYKNMEVIGEPTWNILAEALQRGNEFKKRLPVMVINILPSEKGKKIRAETAALNAPEIKPLRKFIAVN